VIAWRAVLLDTTTTWRRRRNAAISTSPTAWHLVGVDDVETLSCTTRLCDMLPFQHSVFAFLYSERRDFCAETCPFCQPLCATTRRFYHAFAIEINVFYLTRFLRPETSFCHQCLRDMSSFWHDGDMSSAMCRRRHIDVGDGDDTTWHVVAVDGVEKLSCEEHVCARCWYFGIQFSCFCAVFDTRRWYVDNDWVSNNYSVNNVGVGRLHSTNTRTLVVGCTRSSFVNRTLVW